MGASRNDFKRGEETQMNIQNPQKITELHLIVRQEQVLCVPLALTASPFEVQRTRIVPTTHSSLKT